MNKFKLYSKIGVFYLRIVIAAFVCFFVEISESALQSFGLYNEVVRQRQKRIELRRNALEAQASRQLDWSAVGRVVQDALASGDVRVVEGVFGDDDADEEAVA